MKLFLKKYSFNIFLLLFILEGCAMSGSSPFDACTELSHRWPESIAISEYGEGDIYFTDVVAGKLYRIQRTRDGTLDPTEKPIVEGLKPASGLSINQEENILYMGAGVRQEGKILYKIIGIPLNVFDDCSRFPYAYQSLKKCAAETGTPLSEFDIPQRPNGVVFDKKSGAVYYTWLRLSLLKKKGHIGQIPVKGKMTSPVPTEIFSPNGIDIDPRSDKPAFWVTITRDHVIKRLTMKNDRLEENYSIDLDKGDAGVWGHLPDGLMAHKNGDLLVATFGSGKILFLKRDGNGFYPPVPIAEGLGNPTDLAIGRSSKNDGKSSLFVTTKQGLIFTSKSIAKGKVIEIPDIESRIKVD
jgi:sugar lactone lactonase YvrE